MHEAFGGKYSHSANCGHCGAQAVGAESAHVCVRCGTAEVAGASLYIPLAVSALVVVLGAALLVKRLHALGWSVAKKPLTA